MGAPIRIHSLTNAVGLWSCLAFALGVWFPTSSAQAGCAFGYSAHRTLSAQQALGFDLLTHYDAIAGALDPIGSDEWPGPSPCAGLRCASETPQDAKPTLDRTSNQEPWAHFAGEACDPEEPRMPREVGASATADSGMKGGVFHPPRIRAGSARHD